VKKIIFSALLPISLWYMTGCAVHPVTLEKEFMIISEGKEIAIGRRSDPFVLQQFGYYDDPVLQEYITRVGQKLVSACRRKDIEYYFKVLDSEDINAFALPGGYIYITRGMLALINSEAELAGVLGHEVGHVVGRDSANLISQQTWFQIVALAGMAVSPTTRELAVAGNLLFDAVMLGYGREKEHLADSQAVEYMYRAGYDPLQMSQLQRDLAELVQGPAGYGRYLSTHPDIFDRIHRTEADAKIVFAMQDALTGQDRSSGNAKGMLLADEYKSHLDGLAYGPKDQIRRIKIYTVEEGDTLEAIALKAMGSSKKAKEIAFLNGLEIAPQLHPGQKLKVVY